MITKYIAEFLLYVRHKGLVQNASQNPIFSSFRLKPNFCKMD